MSNGYSISKKTVKATTANLPLKRNLTFTKHLRNILVLTNSKATRKRSLRICLRAMTLLLSNLTGGGKSLCYQLPALVSEGVAIIVSPLIALMKNQVDLVRSYSNIDSVAHFLNSTLTKKEIREVHDDLLTGKTKCYTLRRKH